MRLTGITVLEDFLPNPDMYRDAVLKLDFKSFHFERCTFHGIAIDPEWNVPVTLTNILPNAAPTLSFFRKSPEGQQEPHFIHTDIDMGDWSAILYLNPNPPEGDGTTFWTHKATGEIENTTPHLRSEEGRTPDGWIARETVQAKFNRLVMFPSSYFHSRAIFENWSNGDEARLTQVVFGRYE